MAKVVLGIDTSNYKTSVALTDENGNIRYQRSEFLKVEQGKRGLRQSVAFFHHCQVLPSFIEEAFQTVDPKEIISVAVSSRPRNVEGSYMPVFLSGVQTGTVISSALQVPMNCFLIRKDILKPSCPRCRRCRRNPFCCSISAEERRSAFCANGPGKDMRLKLWAELRTSARVSFWIGPVCSWVTISRRENI